MRSNRRTRTAESGSGSDLVTVQWDAGADRWAFAEALDMEEERTVTMDEEPDGGKEGADMMTAASVPIQLHDVT